MTVLTHPKALNIAEHATPEQLRRAIDLVATLRARVLRVGLFGTRMYRPDPQAPADSETRVRDLNILEGEVELITTVMSTLRHGSPLPDTPQIITDWIALTAGRMPQTLACIEQLGPLSRDVLDAARSQSPLQGPALAQHLKIARGGFFEAVTTLSEALWDDLGAQHQDALERATKAAKSLNERLARLERIGKHVRLVSLNASVEAARAGDVGKGLMVIAREFKSLAEEIQKLAKDAGQDMAQIS